MGEVEYKQIFKMGGNVMLMLKILLGVGVIFVLIALITFINNLYEEKFQIKPFSAKLLIFQILSGSCFYIAYHWYEKIKKSGGDKLNPIVLFILGVIIAILLCVYIYKKTDLVYGTLGSLINFGLIYIGAYAIVVFIAAIMLFILFGMVTSRNEDENRYDGY